MDLTGKIIMTREFYGNENTLETGNLNEGVYFLVISYPGGNETLKMYRTSK